MSELSFDPAALPAPESLAPLSAPPSGAWGFAPPRHWTPSPFAASPSAHVDLAQLRVEVVTSAERLADLEPQWQALADDAVEPNVFYEPWMVLPALRHLQGPRPVFAAVWGADAAHPGQRVLCGLFPVVERAASERLGRSSPRRLSLWRYRGCALAAPLLRRGVPRETFGAFLRWLVMTGRARRALVHLDPFPGDGPLAQTAIDVLRADGWAAWEEHAFTRALFRPAPTVEQFFATALSAKRRKEWRRLQARLGEVGRIELEELEGAEQLHPWLQAFWSLEASGRGRERAASEEERRFLEAACRQALLRGRLQLLALKVDGRRIAMKLNLFGAGGAGFALKAAYDEQFARFSPGVLLELENIVQLHALPRVQSVDSCAEPSRVLIHQLWPERRQLRSVYLAAPGAASQLALSLLPLLRWGEAQGRRLGAGWRAWSARRRR